MALCGAAGIWTAFWVVAGRCGQTPNGAAGVRTHIENNVFEFERHGATRRCASGVRPPLDPHQSWGRGSNGCRSRTHSVLGEPFPQLLSPANSSLRCEGCEPCCAELMWRPRHETAGVCDQIEGCNLVLLSPEPSLTLRGWPARPRLVWRGVEVFWAPGRLAGAWGSW